MAAVWPWGVQMVRLAGGVAAAELVERAAAELAAAVALAGGGEFLARAERGGVVCEVRVGRPGRPRTSAELRAEALAAVRAAGKAVVRKQVVAELARRGRVYDPTTVGRALAELVKAGDLVNDHDNDGYRPAGTPGGWRRDQPPLPGCG